jgi:glutamine amidotransferase
MSRLFAFVCNDPDRVRCALAPAERLLVATPDPGSQGFDGWGIGFYQGGEVLLQRRPKSSMEPVDLFSVARELRTDTLIGHVRQGTTGPSKNENTHPFRFRSWLFAHHGTVPSFERVREELLGQVPDFLRRNIRGQTDSEHLFHLLLAYLHDAGKLDDPHVRMETVVDAVRATMAHVDRALVAAGHDPAQMECAAAVTNGRVLLATRRGKPVHILRIDGILDCPVCREAPQFGRDLKRIDHEHLRSVLIVADAPPDPAPPFHVLPDDHLVTVARDLTVTELPLKAEAAPGAPPSAG